MATTQQTPVARRKQILAGVLPPKQTPLIRVLRDAMSATVRGVKPLLRRRFVFDNAGNPDRHCCTDALAIAVEDALQALQASRLTALEQREQAMALPRALEAYVAARFAPIPVSLTEQLLRASRTDAAEDMTLAEALAHPSDPSVQLRAADMMAHEAREKLSVATAIRAFFHRTTHRGSAA